MIKFRFHTYQIIFLVLLLGSSVSSLFAQDVSRLSFTVSAPNPSDHLFHVQVKYTMPGKKELQFRMCAWTPGFYEIQEYGQAISNFTATDLSGKRLSWAVAADSSWRVQPDGSKGVILNYDVKAENPFIANANLTQGYGYFVPGAVLMYLDEAIAQPLTLQIIPYKIWPQKVATGLDELPGRPNTYLVPNFDVLYDSPFLMGKLEEFPASSVKGKKLQFLGYQMGGYNHQQLMNDVTKMALSASEIIGDVPFEHYSFLGIGMPIRGFGGIEHLNSSSLLMANDSTVLADPKMKEIMYAFLAHEYFHLYNVKRIRPIALGPFDYSKENYTNMLWVSEGFTDYYAYLILKRAGLISQQRVLANYQEHIRNYENTPGHLYQSLTQSSRGIWAQRGRPQARTEEEKSKTISVYDKGCALGMLLDLKIRHETKNRKSLDDVMRSLYKKYYQMKSRGFTDLEFQQECELAAGVKLTEVFSYATSVDAVNYPKYLAYAGLEINTADKSFSMTKMDHPDALQSEIYNSWLR